jgi:hypothetical protein
MLHANMLQILWLILASLLVGGAHSVYGQSKAEGSTDAVIDVYGWRRESFSTRMSGQSITIRPEDASRFDSVAHLKRESSVITPETSRISPSGFVVPKIRGQDPKLTDVYLDDIQLQDPYSGLPLIEDLDLRAFGGVELHQGLPPPEVPGLNPIGTMRYLFRPPTRPSMTGGLGAGQPFGHAIWTLGLLRSPEETPESSTIGRIYARAHQTSGHFPYYSDNGTPYNRADDRSLIRDNNDQRSQQIVPYFEYQSGPYKVRFLGWSHHADRGLPSMSVVIPSLTRETVRGSLGALRVSRTFAAPSASYPLTVSLGTSGGLDSRETLDPGRRFLGAAQKGRLRIWSRRGQVQIVSHLLLADLYLNAERALTSIRNQLDQRMAIALNRRSDVGTIGLAMTPLPYLRLEAKGSLRAQSDTKDSASGALALPGDPVLQDRESFARASGGSLALGREDRALYIQAAFTKRLPSLIEQFGDGSAIRPNGDLRPEVIRHHEMGGFIKGRSSDWRLGVATYQDVTTEKIVFIPVLANASKALNLAATTLKGMDFRGEYGFGETRLFLSVSRLLPYDVTRSKRRLLPGIAEHVATAEVTQNIAAFTLRWLGRYRSDVYRDLGNTVKLPGAFLQDASIDFRTTPESSREVRVGLSLRNLTDLRSIPISAPETEGSDGRTSYSDYSGAPLPGRQWTFSLAATI